MIEKARAAGKALAEAALKQKIKKVVFDRGGFIYTGRVQAFAEGAREGGLEF
jgi:large subunit ribosomal protein L18